MAPIRLPLENPQDDGVVLEGMEQTWFITGSSRGLGRALVRAALDAGDRVVATARQPAQLEDLVDEYGERIHAIGLDVTDAHAARSAIADARRHFGRLDVIVNNAGYANVSPIETTDDEDFRAQFETNFWGVYHVSKAAIPVLREQGAASSSRSLCGRTGRRLARDRLVPGRQVRDRRLQPGAAGRDRAVRCEGHGRRAERLSDRLGRLLDDRPRHPRGLRPTVGVMNSRVRQSTDGPAGDPARAAEILVRVAKRRDIPYHLPLGVNAVEGSDPSRRAPPRRGPQMERREPLRRLQRALSRGAPGRHARHARAGWALEDSNLRPQPCEGCALTN